MKYILLDSNQRPSRCKRDALNQLSQGCILKSHNVIPSVPMERLELSLRRTSA